MTKENNMPLNIIHRAVCKHFNVQREEIFSRTRVRDVVEMRQIFHYLAKKHTKYSLTYIGLHYKEVSNNTWDHGTVIHSIKTIEGFLLTNKMLANDILKIEGIMEGLKLMDDDEVPKLKLEIVKILFNNDEKSDLLKNLITYINGLSS